MGAESGHEQGAAVRIDEIGVDQLSEIVERTRRPRRRLLWAILIAILTTGATVGSIIGQGVSYRQMRALESISDALARGSCAR